MEEDCDHELNCSVESHQDTVHGQAKMAEDAVGQCSGGNVKMCRLDDPDQEVELLY
jgi:hypothetical protein